jgi:hypothetical protein
MNEAPRGESRCVWRGSKVEVLCWSGNRKSFCEVVGSDGSTQAVRGEPEGIQFANLVSFHVDAGERVPQAFELASQELGYTKFTSFVQRGMREDRQELDTIRQVIDEELYEWAEYPFGQKPGYLGSIAGDAGVDIYEVNRLHAQMKRFEHNDEAKVDRLHHQLGKLVEEMRKQVKNASLEQVEKYRRARERWIGAEEAPSRSRVMDGTGPRP